MRNLEDLTPVELAILKAGDFYNETMQRSFGNYRFSDTISSVSGGEPPWLHWLHETYRVSSERADRGARR